MYSGISWRLLSKICKFKFIALKLLEIIFGPSLPLLILLIFVDLQTELKFFSSTNLLIHWIFRLETENIIAECESSAFCVTECGQVVMKIFLFLDHKNCEKLEWKNLNFLTSKLCKKNSKFFSTVKFITANFHHLFKHFIAY